jgi:hypothetical protein
MNVHRVGESSTPWREVGMSYNPYSDETVQTRAENYSPMGDLEPKQQQQQYAVPQTPATEQTHTAEQGEHQDDRRQRAKATMFVIGKFNDYLVWFLMVLETMLALRFLLKLIGADPNVIFAGFLYAVTEILLLPFLNLVSSPTIHPPNQSFEFSTLIGMVVYFMIFYALKRFARLLVSPPEDSAG